MPTYWQPTGTWKEKFRKALKQAFDETSVTLLIADYFGPETFPGISPPGPGKSHEFRLHELIEHARVNDWLIDLVAAARERRPKNPEISEIAKDLGLTIGGPRFNHPTGKSLEEIIQPNAKFINPSVLREKLGTLEGQVCWVDIPGGGGTGFLVGANLVLTADHVIDRLLDGRARWKDVKCRFDYKQAIDGTTLDRKNKTEVGLDAVEWLIDRLPPSESDRTSSLGNPSSAELDYALLRLAEKVGDLPVGGDTVDPHAQPRGWIDIMAVPPPLVAGNQVFLLQHPKGEPLQLAIGTVTGFNSNGTRMRYDANSKDGSSGSPCFNIDFQLVGLHHARDLASTPKWNQAIPFAEIKKVWKYTS